MPTGTPTELRILVVEDEAELRELYKDSIEARGHRVFCAANGREALQWLKDNKVDAMITDIRMPELTGTDLILALRQQGAQIPVTICVSAYSDLNLADAYRMGVDAYFNKPVSSDEILAALEHFHRERHRRSLAEDKLRHTLVALEEGEAKGRLASGLRDIAAALEGPLSTAWGCAAMLRQELEQSTLKKHQGLRQLASKVDSSVGELARVVASLKLLASEDSRSQVCDLQQIVAQALTFTASTLQRQHVSVKEFKPSQSYALQCQPSTLLQGLTQLLLFSAEQMQEGSWLEFNCESMSKSILLRVCCSKARGKLAALGGLRQHFLKAGIELDVCRTAENLEFDLLIPLAKAGEKAA